MRTRFLSSFIFLLNAFLLSGQSAYWTDIAEQGIQNPGNYDRYIYPTVSRIVELDIAGLRSQLKLAGATEQSSTVLLLPMPDGTTERFEVWEESVMHPDLQAKYPEIRTYTGRGLDDGHATLRCDLTPQGFHAMTLGGAKGQVFIDPLFHGYDGLGIVYFKKDYPRTPEHHFDCHTVAEVAPSQGTEFTPVNLKVKPQAEFIGDCQRRQYRLALSCTGEYAAFHGGTKPLALAAMNTSMNRVNGVYMRDFAVTMQIIPNNDTLIFLVAATDPFTNGNGSTMLGQNQTTVTARIGSANYDIGHVFSTGGGGVAGYAVVCSNGSKARGVTGSGSPVGDPFDIDYVAHEMGHQFSGSHSFNNSCGGNIVQAAAMEPGSGSTIMAYAGICSPNVQNNSDDYFHGYNITEMGNFINTGGGNSCPVKTVTGNSAPVATALPNYNIPKSTPFALTADATDPDGDPLTYCWEQMNPQSATMPPVSTSTGGPLFRSYDPVASPTRYFPRLPDLVNNTTNTWEKLPSVGRNMNFRMVVRDNDPMGSCTDEDDVLVAVNGTSGPFAVTVPNTNVTWLVGESQTITWSVAGSDLAPVNCANVKISLSTDGGFNYPVVLAESVPNNGSATITVPDNVSTTCRIKVESVGNIFFDISNANFRIQAPPTPTFVLATSAGATSVCAGTEYALTINNTALAGFNGSIDYVATGAPVGANVVFTPNPTPAGSSTVMTISGLTSAMVGSYSMIITGTSGALVKTANFALTVLPGIPVTPTGTTPSSGITGLSNGTLLSWGAVDFTQNYTVEISTNPGFAPATEVTTLNSDTTFTTLAGLTNATPYYWRVQAANGCGESAYSPVSAFQMGGEACNKVFQYLLPLAIDVNGIVLVNAPVNVPESFVITDLDVTVDANHTWVGDLDAMLLSPMGDTVRLFDRPGSPASGDGCDGDDLIATFDDDATNTAEQFEDACANAPAISGEYQPAQPLAAFNGNNANGTWTLRLFDNYAGFDAGVLNGVTLSFCTNTEIMTAVLANNNPLNVPNAATRNITTAHLSAIVNAEPANQLRYTLLSLPQYGQLRLNGTAMDIGTHFTQGDIDNGLVSYVHGGNTATTADQFKFDLWNTVNNSWLHNQTFTINIIQSTLAATAVASQNVSCNNGTNGQITVSATGGTEPLQYSLNGGAPQASNVFSNLGAGTYTPAVTDANGFTLVVGSAVLNNPAALTSSTAVSLDDLTILAAGGTSPYTYSLDGTNFQISNAFDNLPDGIYNYTVTDANGCTATGQAAVSVGALLATAQSMGTILCNGDLTGALSVSAVGGFAPYQYTIDGVNFQNSNMFGNLAAGTYTVTILDSNGGNTLSNAVTITEPTVLSASTQVEYDQVTLIAVGGAGNFSYTINGGAPQPNPVFTLLDNGIYTLTVTDGNGCVTTTTAEVAVAPIVSAGGTVTNLQVCTGNFDVTFTATGGVPPLEYSLNGVNWQLNGTFTNLTPGTYTVQVRDASGNQLANGSSVTIAPPVPVTVMSNVIGKNATLVATGGTEPYTYTVGANSNPTGIFNNLPNGLYTATITDANGCTGTATFMVSYTAMTLTSVVTNILCAGNNNGTITWNVTGGLPPYTPAMPQTIGNLAAGTYSITVTDATGTTVSMTASVTSPTALTAAATPNGNGTVTVMATGGTMPYQYSINGGTSFQGSSTFTNVPNGTYNVVVRDANGCTTTIQGLVVVGLDEVATAWGLALAPNPSQGQFVLAIGNAPSGALQLSVTDWVGRVVWTKNTNTSGGAFQQVIDLTGKPAGTYLLHLSDGVSGTAIRMVLID